MKSLIVFAVGIIFLVAGLGFYSMASNLNQLGPIKVGGDPSGMSGDLALAAKSGFDAYIADKLSLVGQMLIAIGAFTWIGIPIKSWTRNNSVTG